MNKDIAIVILAAGDGTRMQSDLPKVMHTLHDRPLIDYVVSAAETCKVEKPIVVVSPKHTLVQDFLQERAQYVVQEQQLGTGHAAYVSRPLVEKRYSSMVVLYGDMPHVNAESLRLLIDTHVTAGNTLTMMTATVDTFEGIYTPLYKSGRIIRDASGNIVRNVELKDASTEEQEIREVNSGMYCFDTDWFFDQYEEIGNSNAQGEYYLTDYIALAVQQGRHISSIAIDPIEALGVNTQEDLQRIHQ